MGNELFKEGTIIKGKQLKEFVLCKVLWDNMESMREYQYKMGMNVDINPLVTKGTCEAGLYFCLIKDIYNHLGYGTQLAIVSIPDDEDVYVDYDAFRTHKLNIDRIMPLCQIETWKYLIENGIDITAESNYAIKIMADNGYLDVVKYLHENGADITVDDNYAVRYAARNGYLDLVKYLHENGADITAYENDAVISAAENGHLEVVKYLHENGADITASDNRAVMWAATGGYLDLVKYLHENGADITTLDNHSILFAAANGHLEVVKYLYANGADITARNNCAIKWAKENGHTEMVQYLETLYLSDLNIRDSITAVIHDN